MGFPELIQDGWRDHERDTAAVALRLEAGVGLVGTADQATQLVHLANHAVGQHLGDWARAARIAEAALARLGEAPPTPVLLGLVAVGRYLAADVAGGLAAEARAAAGDPAQAAGTLVRVRMLAAEALVASGRAEEGWGLWEAALPLAEALPAGTPAVRAAAMASNNLASGLLERAGRAADEDRRLRRAAEAARTLWLRVGDWTNDERADYLLALVANAQGRHGDAVLHAERGLTTIQQNGEEPVDAAFLRLALARAYRGLDLPREHGRELAEADRLAATFDDAGLREWFAAERAKGA